MASKESKSCSRLLTSQERRVLSLIAEGFENKEIAFELGVSANVVSRYKDNLIGKFGASNISTIIQLALRERLINPYDILESRFSRRGT